MSDDNYYYKRDPRFTLGSAILLVIFVGSVVFVAIMAFTIAPWDSGDPGNPPVAENLEDEETEGEPTPEPTEAPAEDEESDVEPTPEPSPTVAQEEESDIEPTPEPSEQLARDLGDAEPRESAGEDDECTDRDDGLRTLARLLRHSQSVRSVPCPETATTSEAESQEIEESEAAETMQDDLEPAPEPSEAFTRSLDDAEPQEGQDCAIEQENLRTLARSLKHSQDPRALTCVEAGT